MTTYYFDTSALVKNYVDEVGSKWVRQILNENVNHFILTSFLSITEIYSAFNRRLREGSVSNQDYQININAFHSDGRNFIQFLDLTLEIIDHTRTLLETHPLRANDSIQLASALIANNSLTSAGLTPIVFLSSDDQLNRAALAQGLVSENPEAMDKNK